MTLALTAACHRGATPAPGAGSTAGVPAPPADAANLLRNPSFEDGRDPWFSMDNPFWGTFVVAGNRAHAGEHSLLLRLRSEGSSLPTLIRGAVQDFGDGTLPERLSGYYRVENWQRGAQNQYLQALVSITGADNLPDPEMPKQVAWVLTGVLDPVWDLPDRQFVFLGPPEPREGEWIPFDIDVRTPFVKRYGVLPTGLDGVRLYLEVRYEKRDPASEPEATADVYLDDLFAGDGS